MDEIMYGALPRILTDRRVKLPKGYAAWWAYLRDVTNTLLGRGHLHRNADGQIVSVVAITHIG